MDKKKFEVDGFYIKAGRKKKGEVGYRKGLKNLDLAISLGFNLAIPVVAGVILGRYLDKRFGGEIYTLTLVLVGLIISLYNLYRIYKQVV